MIMCITFTLLYYEDLVLFSAQTLCIASCNKTCNCSWILLYNKDLRTKNCQLFKANNSSNKNTKKSYFRVSLVFVITYSYCKLLYGFECHKYNFSKEEDLQRAIENNSRGSKNFIPSTIEAGPGIVPYLCTFYSKKNQFNLLTAMSYWDDFHKSLYDKPGFLQY